MKLRSFFSGVGLGAVLLAGAAFGASRDANLVEPIVGEETAVLTDAPNVPPPIQRDHATKVVIHLEVKEVEGQLADGVRYTFWTFGGHVPGKFIRIREGDEVEFHLDNHPDNKNPHNIDLHAVNGPGGGAAASLTAPGHSSVFSFKALNPGLFVYHCATAPVAMHVGNGMYGMIWSSPRRACRRSTMNITSCRATFTPEARTASRAFSPSAWRRRSTRSRNISCSTARSARPSATRRSSPRSARRCGCSSATADRTSPHPSTPSARSSIGLSRGRDGGAVAQRADDDDSSGGAAIIQFKMSVPGTFILVDHSLERAFNRGALAQLKVIGPEDKLVYSGKQYDLVYQPEGTSIRVAQPSAAAPVARSKEERIALGADVFANNCQACHQADGEGVPDAFPPLAKSDYLNGDKIRAIKTVTGGLERPLTVNGKAFNGVMPAWSLSDEDIAGVLTYVYSKWGNSGQDVTPQEVNAYRVKATE